MGEGEKARLRNTIDDRLPSVIFSLTLLSTLCNWLIRTGTSLRINIPGLSDQRRDSFLSACIGLGAGLLGFLIAAVAILVADRQAITAIIDETTTPRSLQEEKRLQRMGSRANAVMAATRMLLCASSVMGLLVLSGIFLMLFARNGVVAGLSESLLLSSLFAGGVSLILSGYGLWAVLTAR